MQDTFSLIDGSKDVWKLGGVTPRREKLLTGLNLIKENVDVENKDNVDAVLKKLLDGLGEDLLKLLNGLFVGRDITKEELEDLDKTQVKVAVFGFFLSDLALLREFGNLIPTSTLRTLTTQKPESSEG